MGQIRFIRRWEVCRLSGKGAERALAEELSLRRTAPADRARAPRPHWPNLNLASSSNTQPATIRLSPTHSAKLKLGSISWIRQFSICKLNLVAQPVSLKSRVTAPRQSIHTRIIDL